MSHQSLEIQNMKYQRMSSSSDCSDEDEGKQPSSLLRYWQEIRPSSTDEDSEPEVTPARTPNLKVSSSTECQQNGNNNSSYENPRGENSSPSQASSISHTNRLIENTAPVHAPVHQPQTEESHSECREEQIITENSLWHPIPVPDPTYRPDQQFIMHQQWRSDRSDSDLLPENNFKDHCCWNWIQSIQFRSFYSCCFVSFVVVCAFVFLAFTIFFYFVFR